MKTKITRSLAGVVAALLAMPLATLVMADGPVVESISGSGGFFGADGKLRTFTFNAQKDADGNVRGEWTRVNKGEETTPNHGKITCFVDYGDYVLVGGFTSFGFRSEPPNNGVAFWFVDNGQGAAADPDIMSLQSVGNDPFVIELYCQDLFGPVFPSFDVTQGNVQVR